MTFIPEKFRLTTYGRSLRILNRADQKKVFLITALQIFMAIFDFIGVFLIGLLTALSVAGMQTQEPGSRIISFLKLLHISEFQFQTQAAILGITAVIFLVGKTVVSIFFTRRILYFLARRGASVSTELVARLLSQPLLMVQSRTTQETLYALTTGVSLIALQVLATSMVLAADLSLLLIMGIGLFLFDPLVALGSGIVFACVGYYLYQFMHVRAGILGRRNWELTIQSNEKIIEVLGSYRESIIRNRRDFYSREIGRIRNNLASTSAELSFLPYVSKYVIETAVVLGSVMVGISQFFIYDTSKAVTTLAVFLAAGTRIAPAILRLQQGAITIRESLGGAAPTLDLIDSLPALNRIENFNDTVDLEHLGFVPHVQVSEVYLKYSKESEFALEVIDLEITPGHSIAIVGPSGSGKTTLIDVLLGILSPETGRLLISGLPPLASVSRWPGAISYVPQDVVIVAGTIRQNISLGFPQSLATDELVLLAAKAAGLEEFISQLPNGLDSEVGERGTGISGGQRQRIGIARAMFTQPLLLVLDEATSALDGETESLVNEAIQNLRGRTTIIMIAHRLSTIRNADIVVYMEKGKVLAQGSFNEVRKLSPEFDRQAKSVGL